MMVLIKELISYIANIRTFRDAVKMAVFRSRGISNVLVQLFETQGVFASMPFNFIRFFFHSALAIDFVSG